MPTPAEIQQSYFLRFPRQRWADFREDTPLSLGPADLEKLRGTNDPVSLAEVEQVYLPLSRLLNLYVAASQQLHSVTTRFLGDSAPRVPYIIAVSGSVGVGKSTTSRVLQALLSRWPHHPRVALLTTDGFLHPNATLQARGIMHRKGFPESYDLRALLRCLQDLKAGKTEVEAPVYSHHSYDIVPGDRVRLEAPDIVIVEGLNVLQVGHAGKRQARLFVSDFFDFSIYVDAPSAVIRQWYIERFALFATQARRTPDAYFHRFADMSRSAMDAYAIKVWTETNEVNLHKNILPFRERARLILQKDAHHRIENILLRRA